MVDRAGTDDQRDRGASPLSTPRSAERHWRYNRRLPERWDPLWSNESIRIICGIHEIALALRGVALDTRDLLFLDARTGSVIEEIGNDMARAQEFQNICAERSVLDGWVNSEPFSDEHPRFDLLARIISREIVEQRGEAHVAEYGSFTVIGAHERSRRSADAMLQGVSIVRCCYWMATGLSTASVSRPMRLLRQMISSLSGMEN